MYQTERKLFNVFRVPKFQEQLQKQLLVFDRKIALKISQNSQENTSPFGKTLTPFAMKIRGRLQLC